MPAVQIKKVSQHITLVCVIYLWTKCVKEVFLNFFVLYTSGIYIFVLKVSCITKFKHTFSTKEIFQLCLSKFLNMIDVVLAKKVVQVKVKVNC